MAPTKRRSTTKGFARTSSLLRGRIRDASASRGFEQSRLLTQWEEIAGPQMAAIARPVEVTYARGGFGATLVLLTTGANAPMLEMQKHQLKDRVNAVYGYSAISRIRITQTAPRGFADGKVAFGAAPKAETPQGPDASTLARAERDAQGVENTELRSALSLLGANIMSKTNR